MIYVASKTSHAPIWLKLREEGWPIISTWINEADAGATASYRELWTRIEKEVRLSNILVLYCTPNDFPLKGALVEVGMALAQGKYIVLCMPGVVLDGRTDRPVGSWIRHPNVIHVSKLDRHFIMGLQ